MKKTINQELMRATNKKQILLTIRKSSPATVKDLSEQLGLSTTSVTTFINELITENKIMNCGTAKSTGGRKSTLYRLNPNAQYFIGIDLQVDRIIGVLLDFGGNETGSAEMPLHVKDEWQVTALLRNMVETLINKNSVSIEHIGGVGIGVPGIVNHRTGNIEFAPNLGWKNVNLSLLLDLEVPVKIENEANAAAWGEKTFGAARDVANMIFISVGIGIGCGLIIENRLFTGPSFHAGEFGHMTVVPGGIPCQCGNFGCWEVYASNEAALHTYTLKTGRSPENFDELLTLAAEHDAIAENVLDEIIQYLGLGIANIVNGLNPETVVVGGKIIEADNHYNRLLKHIKDHCLDKTFGDLAIKFSGLENKAAALGVAAMMMD